jgi:hypothetical protein
MDAITGYFSEHLEGLKTIAALGTLALGIIAGIATFLNYRNSVRWKHAELASKHLMELNSDAVLLFACRSLDWDIGILVIPESLQPIVANDRVPPPIVIAHDKKRIAEAMVPDPHVHDAVQTTELQLYRTAIDSLLSWLSVVRQGLGRKLFTEGDIEPVAWWVFRVEQLYPQLEGYLMRFGYREDIDDLRRRFRKSIDKFLASAQSDKIV